MIKFFRRIRESLIKENKTSKYLLYAAGEIILVVIGILIAVQLNNLNEQRKQRLVEIDILRGIKSDILKDTIDLNSNISGYKESIKKDNRVLNHILNKNEMTRDFIRGLQSYASEDYILVLHDSYFQEAKLKGLSIISNKELRESISRLYDFQYKVVTMLENNIESYNHNMLLKNQVSQYLAYNKKGFTIGKKSYAKLLEDDKITFQIRQAQNMKAVLLNLHQRTLDDALNVINDIDKELKK